jgi:glycosyltransferase A (GT-A) superfamily protein (DUF2064 family)
VSSSATVGVAIVARAPRAGAVKTRRRPPLASERALFEGLAPDFALTPPRGRGLRARLRSALGAPLRAGHRAAIALGTDTPTPPAALLQRAVDLAASRDVDVLLGPAEDGGDDLIGVRADHPTLFDDIPWSTPAALRVTRRRADAAGLRNAFLPTWFDVDTAEDLARLRATLVGTAPATPRVLVGRDAVRRRHDTSRR